MSHGHAVGDVALFGGDEFVVVLSELDVDKAKSSMQASIIAEKNPHHSG